MGVNLVPELLVPPLSPPHLVRLGLIDGLVLGRHLGPLTLARHLVLEPFLSLCRGLCPERLVLLLDRCG